MDFKNQKLIAKGAKGTKKKRKHRMVFYEMEIVAARDDFRAGACPPVFVFLCAPFASFAVSFCFWFWLATAPKKKRSFALAKLRNRTRGDIN